VLRILLRVLCSEPIALCVPYTDTQRMTRMDTTAAVLTLSCVKCAVLVCALFYNCCSVPRPRVDECFSMVNEAEALLVVGSSLMVYSGFRFVEGEFASS
jgi:NAD-dependent SIR2 family protein deacetylase